MTNVALEPEILDANGNLDIDKAETQSGTVQAQAEGDSEEETNRRPLQAWLRYCEKQGGPIVVKIEASDSAPSDGSSEEADSAESEEEDSDEADAASRGNISLRDLCLDYEPVPDSTQEAEAVLPPSEDLSTSWHIYECARGEIRLSEDEIRSIRKYFELCGCASHWRLTGVPETTTNKNSKQKRAHTSGGDTRVRHVKRAPQDHDGASSPPSNRQAQSNQSLVAPAMGHTSNHLFVRRSTRNAQPFGENLKKAPDWVRRFYRLVSNICQHDDFREIATELSERMTRGEVIASCDSMGVVQPLGLNTILSNLEANEYDAPLDVFNDLYSIWIGAFRRLAPGSDAWIQAHGAVSHFLRLVSSEPLKSDFNPPGIPYDPNFARNSGKR